MNESEFEALRAQVRLQDARNRALFERLNDRTNALEYKANVGAELRWVDKVEKVVSKGSCAHVAIELSFAAKGSGKSEAERHAAYLEAFNDFVVNVRMLHSEFENYVAKYLAKGVSA